MPRALQVGHDHHLDEVADMKAVSRRIEADIRRWLLAGTSIDAHPLHASPGRCSPRFINVSRHFQPCEPLLFAIIHHILAHDDGRVKVSAAGQSGGRVPQIGGDQVELRHALQNLIAPPAPGNRKIE